MNCMDAELLVIIEVDREDRVVCQAPGCGHAVYKRVHVVRLGDVMGVYGSDCYGRLFRDQLGAPRYGGGTGRVLSVEERQLLAQNTERLIARLEAEHQLALERASPQRHHLQSQLQALKKQTKEENTSSQPSQPTAAQLAAVEREAKQMVRAKYGVDPDAPGWRGLVMACQRELLGRCPSR